MQNRELPVIVGAIAVGLLLLGGVIFALTRNSGAGDQTPTEDSRRRRAEPVNVIPVADRPYIRIVPLADGRNLELVVESLNKPATDVEYELEYQSGSQLQGAFGLLELANLPASFRILLGSCSAGGACTYHENITGGTLLTRFQGPENYALKSDWRYFNNTGRETAVASKDAKFQLEAAGLGSIRYLIVFNTAGYPAGLPGTPVSEPYSLTASGALSGTGELTMRSNEEGNLTIYGWNGQSWQAFETTVDGKMATATVQLMELYIVTQ